MDTTQSKDLQDLTDALFAEVKAAEIQMDRLRWEISNNAQWRAQKLRASNRSCLYLTSPIAWE